MTESQGKMVHRLTGLALLLTGVFVVISLVNIYSQSAGVDVGGEVRNVAPETPSIYISSSTGGARNDYTTSAAVSLTAGSTKTIYVNGSVVDVNGFRDISSVTAVVYEAGATGGASCSANRKDCYTVSCTTEGTDTTTLSYDCAVPIYYNALATTKWTATVTAEDSARSTSSASENFAIDSLLSLDYTSELDFGTMTPGGSASATFTATQKGNVAAALRLAAEALTCDSGEIPPENLKYALTDVGIANATSLSTSATTISGAEVARKTVDGSDPEDELIIYLEVPTGVGGACAGTMEVSSASAE
ncbi:MAG: hypothetical protein PHU71_01265 [Candidatus Gracilibacteria bacterium]|nr:hypothetical protein [Candidatus Gracilibacteria bacterium]